jgi:hypothetical protein
MPAMQATLIRGRLNHRSGVLGHNEETGQAKSGRDVLVSSKA